ncbi:MAG TPA: carboxymuconolactone decarboxylase family protein [Acidobacteriota bacterium]|nr:carboxymuconolactone decarboxylase family protein [Acidobacteriota bacterium]
MSEPPSTYLEFKKKYPNLTKVYEALGEECQKAGPLGTKERALAKLCIAIGAGLEGGVHSHTRRALDAGLETDQIRHAVLLSLTTIGFPAMMRTLTWVEDILAKK